MAETTQQLFVSYAGPDREWAEWVGWQLEQAGHRVELDRWDWSAGEDFVQKMAHALDAADAVVALFSKNYFDSKQWTELEWSASVASRKQLVPVAIESLAKDDIPTLLAGVIHENLHGLDEHKATAALLSTSLPLRSPVESACQRRRPTSRHLSWESTWQ